MAGRDGADAAGGGAGPAERGRGSPRPGEVRERLRPAPPHPPAGPGGARAGSGGGSGGAVAAPQPAAPPASTRRPCRGAQGGPRRGGTVGTGGGVWGPGGCSCTPGATGAKAQGDRRPGIGFHRARAGGQRWHGPPSAGAPPAHSWPLASVRLWRRKGVPVPSAGRGRGSRMAGPGRAPAASSARGCALRLSLHRENPAGCALPARDAGRTGQAGHAAAATSSSLAWPDPSTGGEMHPRAPPERARGPGEVQGPRALLALRAWARPAAFFSCGGRAGPARGRKAKQPRAEGLRGGGRARR